MIAIIDYDAGNIASVQKAFQYLGKDVVVTRDPNIILSADHVVLPGVGSFASCMQNLQTYELIGTIKEVVARRIPLLGICLGLQLMFDSSEEGEWTQGLSLSHGTITRLPEGDGRKIPHVGWNSIRINKESRLFQGIEDGSYVYFVHSYYLTAKDPSIVAATTQYGTTIHAAVEFDQVFACQFHPEKSGSVGLKILENFSNIPYETVE